jgi:hypothetical protein
MIDAPPWKQWGYSLPGGIRKKAKGETMNVRRTARATCLLVLACFLSLAAQAQIFRAYVSSTGNDANACTLQAPCRLLPAALAAVADGGEVWMLDSANYNTATVNISKSVTILAIPGAVGSIVSTGGGDAILVSGSSIVVNLRNLVVVALGSSAAGITFGNGQTLTVAGCDISNVAPAIFAEAPGSSVMVVDTVIRNASTGIRVSSTANAMIDHVRISGGITGVHVSTLGRASVTDSVISGAQTGVDVLAQGGTARLTLERTRISGVNYAVFVGTSTALDVAEASVSRSVLTHNSNAAIATQQAASSTASVIVGDTVITENAYGFQFISGGTIYTRGNNTLLYNGSDVSGGSLSSMAGM